MLTVLFSTKNRAARLPEVLECFTRLQSPSGQWKLVIVDNGSTDDTLEVLASFAGRLPLVWFSEPKPGKNSALNTGLAHIEGDLVVFTDDDVFPHPQWLVELRKAADTQSAFSLFGGVILPRWETPPPAWVKWVDKASVYTLTDPKLREGPMPPYLLFGPNMAIRAGVFDDGIHFDPSIGPSGSEYPMGSETELTLRLDRSGYASWHVPAAVVEHFIREEQLHKPWIWRRAIRFGRGQYRILGAEERVRFWKGIPLYLFYRLLKQGIRMILTRVLFQEGAFFRSRWRFHFLCGQVMEARIMAREKSTNWE